MLIFCTCKYQLSLFKGEAMSIVIIGILQAYRSEMQMGYLSFSNSSFSSGIASRQTLLIFSTKAGILSRSDSAAA